MMVRPKVRERVPVALAALVLAGLAGCRSAPADPGATHPASLPEPPAIIATLGLTPEAARDLLFPALRGSPDPNGSRRRCVTAQGSDPAPDWLRESIVNLSCRGPLRELVNRSSGEEASNDAKPQASKDANSQASKDANSQDLVTAAAICGDANALRRQLRRGAGVDAFDSCGTTALVAAAAAGNEAMVHDLLEAGADPDLSTRQGPWSRAPLLAAVVRGHGAIAGRLLDAGAEAEVATAGGRSALMFAVAMKDLALVRRLLESGADPCRKDELGLGASAVARLQGDEDIDARLQIASAKCGRAAGGTRASR